MELKEAKSDEVWHIDMIILAYPIFDLGSVKSQRRTENKNGYVNLVDSQRLEFATKIAIKNKGAFNVKKLK